jgi:4-carboxymuconolactone decarboxylase
MTDRKARAMAILDNMLSPTFVKQMSDDHTASTFAGGLADLSMQAVFEPLWTDERMDLRTRSLVTIGILIALRAREELEIHCAAAIRNGATISDLEQVIYQAAGYAGFPAAASARWIMSKALEDAGLLDRPPA